MSRLNFLPPTLRERKRYIRFQIISEEPVVYEDVEQALWNQFLDTFGEVGVSRMGLWIIRNAYDAGSQTGIIQCNHTSVQQAIVGLGLISRLGDVRVIFKVLGISGTIKGLKI